jgi:hypothetical protein
MPQAEHSTWGIFVASPETTFTHHLKGLLS